MLFARSDAVLFGKCRPAHSCEIRLILSGGGLSGGNEHVWLFTRRDPLPLVSTSAHESTPFDMLMLQRKASVADPDQLTQARCVRSEPCEAHCGS